MRNIFRKSIKFLAGLISLLFISSCITVSTGTLNGSASESVSLDTLFSKDREILLYLDKDDNYNLITLFLEEMELDKYSKSIFDKSKGVYFGFGDDNKSFDLVIPGDFSKSKYEIGLFFSLYWKSKKKEGYKYWVNKDGMNLYFIDDETIILTNNDILPLIKIVEHSIIDAPKDSILILFPYMDDEQNKKYTNGFIKGGVKKISISLNKNNVLYNLKAILELESSGKAKAFSRLIKIFVRLMLSASEDPNIKSIASQFDVVAVESSVIVDNIDLNDKIIIDLINNIVFFEGEADK